MNKMMLSAAVVLVSMGVVWLLSMTRYFKSCQHLEEAGSHTNRTTPSEEPRRFLMVVKTGETQQNYYVTSTEALAIERKLSKPSGPVTPTTYEKYAAKYSIPIEEARLLINWGQSSSFGDFDKYVQQGIRVGGICLRRSLMRHAIIDLLGPPSYERPNQICYSLAGSQLLDFNCDEQGKLLSVQITGKKLPLTVKSSKGDQACPCSRQQPTETDRVRSETKRTEAAFECVW